MRTGIGYDIHKFIKGEELILGGVKIDYKKGLQGHSDADVLVHSLCDALLGAAALGDIGTLFPDTDEKYKDANSLDLLKEVIKRIGNKKYEVNNIDSTLICETPNLNKYRKEMIKNLSDIINIPLYDINIKFTTNEGLDSLGKGESIACLAVATLVPSTDY
ncbi:MAG: 2-C-methyl-D-erythritol 2,4-cyclodiphosphate synthase [Elusimicrobiota bacterium]